MRYLAPLLVMMLLGAATAPEPALAQPYNYGPRERVQSGEVRSLGEILDNVRRQRPGSLADVQGPNVGPSGEARYRLKWVSPNGRVEWLDTDARTGRVLGVQGPERAVTAPNGFPPPGPRAVGPRRQNFAPPGFAPALGPRPRFGRGPYTGRGGFGRGPGGPGVPGRFGPGGPGSRFRPGR